MIMTANVPPDQALAYATLLHFVAFIAATSLGALLLWLFRPKAQETSK
jgi:hypothetical protein